MPVEVWAFSNTLTHVERELYVKHFAQHAHS